MQRIIIKHISGSKANTETKTQDFPLDTFTELTIGRDPSSTIRFDPDDDLVSGKHAKIERDPSDPAKYLITDRGSRNGTFVNGRRLTGTEALSHGAVIQLGPGGPEFRFEVEESKTRTALVPAETEASGQKETVGKATLLRTVAAAKQEYNSELEATKREYRNYMKIGGAALAVVIIGAIALVIYQSRKGITPVSADLDPTGITNQNTAAVVFIQASWKIIDTDTHRQLFHLYLPNLDSKKNKYVPNGPAYIPVYFEHFNGAIEPILVPDDGNGNNKPIGGKGSGSGFVVSKDDGYILTNRHVAASWDSSYDVASRAGTGLLIQMHWSQGGQAEEVKNIKPVSYKDLPGYSNDQKLWVPSRAKAVFPSFDLNSVNRAAKLRAVRRIVGDNDYLQVTFANTKVSVRASLVSTSNTHDVAMLKVDLKNLTEVQINPDDDPVKPGDPVVALGYPSVSPDLYVSTQSKDAFNPGSEATLIPYPTVSVGNIGKILRDPGQARDRDPIYSEMGDSYQLTINSTGAGNSGGPVFDKKGQVIGIFYASATTTDQARTTVTFAVPISYGLELMGTSEVMKSAPKKADGSGR